ncbi:MAG: hypothetical protein Q8Q09_25085 [Deltaproteobacteria bacterium]|nr:hypothetical protein [Deltaproteobacteria bacterium]
MTISTSRFLTAASISTLIALAGCGPVVTPDASTEAGGADASSEAGGGTERTLTYVISTLDVDPTPADSNTAIAGFNLDGLFTDEDGTTPRSCGKPDNPSMLDRDQNCPTAMVGADGRCATAGCAPGAGCRGGVDNQLPAVADAIEAAASAQFPMGVRPLIREQFTTNKISLVIRVTGVNNLENDDAVMVKVYNAYPTFSDGCNAVTSGREYAIAADAVTGGNIEMPTIPAFEGRIVAGRLVISRPGQFPLPLPEIMGARIMLTLTNAQLRLNITEDRGTGGNLGGMFNGSQLLTVVQRLAPEFSMQVTSLIGGFVDIEEPIPTPGSMAGVCSDRMSMPPRFGNIGVGLRFETVRATVAAAPAAARGVGTCGYTAPAEAGAPRG